MIRRSSLACVAAAAAFFAAGVVAHASGASLGLLSLGNAAPVQFDFTVQHDPLASNALTAGIPSTVSVDAELNAPLIANGLLPSDSAPLMGTRKYFGTNIPVADNLKLHVAGSLLATQNDAPAMPVISYLAPSAQQSLMLDGSQSASASLDWNFGHLGFGIGVAVNEDRGTLLSNSGFNAAGSDSARVLGAAARIGFGNGWVTTVSYNEGVSQLDLKPGSFLGDGGTVRTKSYGLAVAKHGLFGDNDLLGVAISRPVQLYAGGFGSGTPGGNANLIGGSQRNSLIGPAPETDIELGYVTTFFDGALALQANAAWQMNLEGKSGTNSLAVLSRAKINF
jgi:hypothetical protein